MSTAMGRAEATGHHGEILQGVFYDDDRVLRRGLVTLPCRHLRSTAVFQPNERGSITVTPGNCEKARRAAALTMAAFSPANTGGHLSIETNIPVGRGMGSSTADVLAGIGAVLDHLDVEPPTDQVMRIALAAETACDSTLFRSTAVLFAHRDAVVIEAFSKPLPPIDFISINADPDAVVDTLEYTPAQYSQSEIENFRPMRSLLRKAIKNADIRLLGRVATASARINERFLPKRVLEITEAIGARYGAVGVQVAHSGTVVGLMFDATDERSVEKMERACRELLRHGFEAKPCLH